MPNAQQLELLDFTVKFAEEQPEFHNQSTWFNHNEAADTGRQNDVICSTKDSPEKVAEYVVENVCGSTGCIAGWGALFAGWCQTRSAIIRDENGMYEYPNSSNARGKLGTTEFEEYGSDTVVNPADGQLISMSEAAQIEFGLNSSQANAIFHWGNTIEDIRVMVEALKSDPDAYLRDLMTINQDDEDDDYIPD